MSRRWVVGLLAVAVAGTGAFVFWPATDGDVVAPPRAVPAAQSAAARALRLPRLRPSPSRLRTPADQPVQLEVRVVVAGTLPADTMVNAGAIEPACGAAFVDTAVTRRGSAVQDALVWVEGPAPVLIGAAPAEHRPTVRLEACRLQPRMQVAAAGSMLQLVMRDSLAESLVVVPSVMALPVDTVRFLMDGQLVPVRQVADSTGVVAIYAAHLPWARAFVAVTPTASGAVSDSTGTARFTLDARGARTTIRAWHPSLGVVSAKVKLGAGGSTQVVTLTFRR
ncbi:MAG: hypothetical protein IT355_19030 [Gemmatimonadaceae bacterium]|nr:hypothetical protein [Gemmatimonadaceae bacterium]